MTKLVNPQFILEKIESECDTVFFSATQDTDYTTANTNKLGSFETLVAGDFTVAQGDVGAGTGKITFNTKPITWSAGGTVTYANFFKSGTSEHVLSTDTGTPKAVNLADDGTINTFDMWEVGVAT